VRSSSKATPPTSPPIGRRDALALMELAELQQLMDDTYGERDRGRGVSSTIAWLVEEIGELAQAIRKGSDADRLHELGDVLALTVAPVRSSHASCLDPVHVFRITHLPRRKHDSRAVDSGPERFRRRASCKSSRS
jgi:MazG nucleotide pyrophosphohydrolase domain